MGVEEVELDIWFPIRGYNVYVWGSEIYLFPERWKLIPMNFHELMHMWLVGASQQMITPFTMLQDGRGLENFQRGQKEKRN